MVSVTTTVVIEPRSLMREALVSFMESHSYKVICSVSRPADIHCDAPKEEQPELVIVGALLSDSIGDDTASIRRRWRDAKIVVLFEHASPPGLQQLLASGVDACIPTDASPRTLIDTLRLVVCEPLRVIMMGGMDERQALSEETLQNGRALEADLASSLEASPLITMPRAVGLDTAGRAFGLSEREEQILKGVSRGYSNKMIGRMHSVSEATVKVHMKAILRKIHVANRTQAAIWAVRKELDAGDDVQDMRMLNGHSS